MFPSEILLKYIIVIEIYECIAGLDSNFVTIELERAPHLVEGTDRCRNHEPQD